jgi:putative hemolysin
LSLTALLIILFIMLLGLFCLTAVNASLRRLHKKDSRKHLEKTGNLFFYRYIHQLFFRNQEYEELFFASSLAQNGVRFFYITTSALILVYTGNIQLAQDPTGASFLYINWPMGVLYLIGMFLLYFIVGDHLSRMLASHFPAISLYICAPIASIFMLATFPITYLFLKFSHLFSKTVYLHPLSSKPNEAKEELIEMIEETDFNSKLDPHDKKLIESVMDFKDLIAREVMVPRVDVFSLEADTTIEQASKSLQNEGYSRTPVYQDTLDNIIGVLMYKDVLTKYMEYATTGDRKLLDAPISSLVKNVLYTPETKKISHLLQEFRKQQVHLAIVVDEYGGTEGIVTIEDILETIVGDIADEYDDQESLFIALPDGGWLIDGRMTIHELEEQLAIDIPQDGDFDTISGYLFHETGTIPHKGFILSKPDFEIEVIRSNDRRVEKLRIKPLAKG